MTIYSFALEWVTVWTDAYRDTAAKDSSLRLIAPAADQSLTVYVLSVSKDFSHRAYMNTTTMSNVKEPLFDPAECASLHNQILQRATQHNSKIAEQFANALEGYSDEIKARLLPDLQDFLAAISGSPVSIGTTPLTPFSFCPDKDRFFQHRDMPQFTPYKDNLIMLYPARDSAGGLFFMQHHKLASWIDSDLQIPPKSSWLPLATILQRWLQMWDTGKITSDLKFKPWSEWDLEAALQAWNELVEAIEERLPSPVTRQSTHEPLIEQTVADKWAEQSFQHAFLTRARRPAFTSVGPGISVWTAKSFDAAHAAEPQDSERKEVIGSRPEDSDDYRSALSRDLAPTCLFPGRAVESTWRDHSKPSLRDYKGRGSALLNRRAGLYIGPEEDWSDAVVFSDGRGRENLFTCRGSCPWMPGRPPALLRDVLAFWKRLVVDDAWQLVYFGVVGNMPHFHCLSGTKKAIQVVGTTTWFDYCTTWDATTSY